jgi:endonuclease/exonuclease/phosphatase family metal-dependent hydrolase
LAVGAENEHGLHGNAITSSRAIADARLIRFELDGHWFGPDSRQPRIGGRMALIGAIQVDGTRLALASVHLESDSTRRQRAAQLELVLQAIDQTFGPGPAVVGGDFNTFSADRSELRSPEAFEALRGSDPARYAWPVEHEPLFEVAAAHGFDFELANLREATARIGTDPRPVLHLDWLLTRGVDVSDPARLSAVDDDGRPFSDHDAVAVTVTLPEDGANGSRPAR